MPGNIDEFYVIRVKRKASDTHKSVTPEREVFVSSTDSFGAVNRARAFDSIEAAEVYLRQRKDRDHYQFQIQYCTLFKQPQESDPIKTITDELMQIPYPYRRTAYNWYRGRDVEMLLKRESDDVYQRHQSLLLDYGIDITTKSDVVLLGRTRKRKKAISPPQTNTAAPRQYFAYPDQRPRPLTGHSHSVQPFPDKQKKTDNS